MNIFLIDSSPYTQKTLRYFLHPYSPTIHSITSQNKKPESLPDIIFLDSDHINHPALEQFEETPVVLISQDEEVLKQNTQKYQAQLKKPLNQKELQEVIHYILPKTKEMPFASHLEFYDPSSASSEKITNKKEEPKAPPIPLEKNPTVPLDEEESSENISTLAPLSSQKKSSDLEAKSPISIPKELTLTDQKEITAFHNTTSFLRKTSQNQSLNKKEKNPKIQSIDEARIQTKSVSFQENQTPDEDPDKTIVQSLEDSSIQAKNVLIQTPPSDQNSNEDLDKTMIQPLGESPIKAKSVVIQTSNPPVDQDMSNEDMDKTIAQPLEKTPIQAQNIIIHTAKPIVKNEASDKAEAPAQNEKQQAPISEKTEPPKSAAENSSQLLDNISLQEISKIIQTSLEDKWNAFQQRLEKELISIISETAQKILREELKKEEDRFTKKIHQELDGIKTTLKQTYEEVSWKVIPEMSKQIIQKEIQKLIDSKDTHKNS